MNIRRITAALVTTGVLIFGGLSPWAAYADEYISKAKSKLLVQEPLPVAEGKEVIIKRFELPPGYVGGRHSHPASVYVYVEQGEFTIDVDGLGRQTFQAGSVYQEPIGRVMQARNLSTDAHATIVVFQVGEQGKPMMVKER